MLDKKYIYSNVSMSMKNLIKEALEFHYIKKNKKVDSFFVTYDKNGLVAKTLKDDILKSNKEFEKFCKKNNLLEEFILATKYLKDEE